MELLGRFVVDIFLGVFLDSLDNGCRKILGCGVISFPCLFFGSIISVIKNISSPARQPQNISPW